MAIFYSTENFTVEAPERPHIPREEGGHLKIAVKDKTIADRTKLSIKQAIELVRLTMIVGEAFEIAMNRRGVPVIKINYQDMGNWSYKEGKKHYMHYHIYGRVLNAKHQPYPESMNLPDRSTGFYDSFLPLNDEDIAEIEREIERISNTEKYIEFQKIIDNTR